MNDITVLITAGLASRFLRPGWVRGGNEIQASAFDLRDRPPEEYVSFFITNGEDDDSCFSKAIEVMRKKLSIEDGAVALLEIDRCLDEVNDEENDIISFQEHKIPHCGMYYHTTDLTKVTEAKNTLRFIARERMRWVGDHTSKRVLASD
ncbi:hypothetical protein MRBLRH8O_001855 [Agrobacterium radiobacter]|uniref:hypothetical protein n=1 Tax=Agrobacterium radiobacter TaxID=362 RepID=UPI0034662825